MPDSASGGTDGLSDDPVNEKRVELYARIMAAEQQIAHELYRRGVGNEFVQSALDAVDERMSEDERREDLYLSALSYYVEALGGQLELRAIFDDETIVIRTEG